MFTRLVCKLKQKTLIVAKQREWLDQFIVAFRDFTNISELEKADGKPHIGWIKKWSDIEKLDIAVVTYQRFIKHPDIVKKYRDAFGIVFVDECDQAAAKCFHKVVNGFSAKYRFGTTGTDKRKDQLHVIVSHVLGPVTVKGKSKQLPCAVTYHYTGFKVGKFSQWNTFLKRITTDQKRTEFILDRVRRDVDLGRWVVLVTDRVAHAQRMTRILQNDGIEAETFWGGMKDRKELFARAKRGEIRVVVAIRKLIQRGIDVTWWDSIHICTPTSNVHNYKQEVARIRTPYDGKPMPTIHFYLDIGAVAHAVKSIAERVHKDVRTT
jgi:superfamily II DNA or RNA helicase